MVTPNYSPEKLKRVLALVKERQAEGWNLHQISQHYGIDREWLRENWPIETKTPLKATRSRG